MIITNVYIYKNWSHFLFIQYSDFSMYRNFWLQKNWITKSVQTNWRYSVFILFYLFFFFIYLLIIEMQDILRLLNCAHFYYSIMADKSRKAKRCLQYVCRVNAALYCGDLGINNKTPNRMLTRRLPHTKCINASPRIRLHASIRLKSEKRKIIKSKVANGKRSRQN